MQFCLRSTCPIVDFCPPGEPELAPLRAVEKCLAEIGFGCPECDSLEACAITSAGDHADMILAHDISLDQPYRSHGDPWPRPANAIRAGTFE